jgi:hypothetical protein
MSVLELLRQVIAMLFGTVRWLPACPDRQWARPGLHEA